MSCIYYRVQINEASAIGYNQKFRKRSLKLTKISNLSEYSNGFLTSQLLLNYMNDSVENCLSNSWWHNLCNDNQNVCVSENLLAVSSDRKNSTIPLLWKTASDKALNSAACHWFSPSPFTWFGNRPRLKGSPLTPSDNAHTIATPRVAGLLIRSCISFSIIHPWVM